MHNDDAFPLPFPMQNIYRTYINAVEKSYQDNSISNT